MTKTQDTTKLAIKYKPIADLIPYARNSRTHSEAQVAQIAASIKEFGWTNIMEFDPKFCDVIVKQWEDFTGKKAILLEA